MDKETIIQLLSDGVISNEAAAKYFPELRESEDDGIKKWCISHFRECFRVASDNVEYQEYLNNKVIPWIEKQGEQKVEVKYVYTKFRIGDVIVEIKPNGYCQPVTVKHVGKWAYSCESDDGKRSLSFPITSQDEYKLVEKKPTNVCEGCNNVKGCVACVDGSEWAHIEEAEPTWSEEDENRFRNLIFLVEHSNEGKGTKEGFVKFIYRLKSLKSKNAWKPSKEQIIALRWILNHIPYNKHKEEISGLLDQINELKG